MLHDMYNVGLYNVGESSEYKYATRCSWYLSCGICGICDTYGI